MCEGIGVYFLLQGRMATGFEGVVGFWEWW